MYLYLNTVYLRIIKTLKRLFIDFNAYDNYIVLYSIYKDVRVCQLYEFIFGMHNISSRQVCNLHVIVKRKYKLVFIFNLFSANSLK